MSRYAIDKVMREVAHDDAAQAAFLADAAAYLDGRDLTEEERAALLSGDYGTLYRLGAHPFLLWAFTRAALPDGGPPPTEYVATITPHGAPDYAT
jgi:hypothetical protein